MFQRIRSKGGFFVVQNRQEDADKEFGIWNVGFGIEGHAIDKICSDLLNLFRMNRPKTLTIIDDKNIRGILAPAKLLSKKLLEDLIDFIELSSPESVKKTERLIGQADRVKSWITARKIEKELGLAR